MSVYECLRTRRTVRQFKTAPVSETTLVKILNAARWAPSSRNQQPWHLVVVKNKKTLTQKQIASYDFSVFLFLSFFLYVNFFSLKIPVNQFNDCHWRIITISKTSSNNSAISTFSFFISLRKCF